MAAKPQRQSERSERRRCRLEPLVRRHFATDLVALQDERQVYFVKQDEGIQ